ncbi:ABC transporter permease [Kitasatospora sp. NPDC088134]|uniref:ABC transporter permease n=1 Tax=Kitasatospora sp. NPDC088134 TaxID=3364071 RepID=UPI0037FD66BC
MTTPTGTTAEGDPTLAKSTDAAGAKPGELLGRTPGQIAWSRFKRNRTGVVCAVITLGYIAAALLAPVISALYGKDPEVFYGLRDSSLLDSLNLPVAPNGGMSSEYWFGITPGTGQDIFTNIVYGIRTSLGVGLIVVATSTVLGVVVGLAQGYLGGTFDYLVGRFSDMLLALPTQLTAIAFFPIVVNAIVPIDKETPFWVRLVGMWTILALLGWMGMARLIRSITISLREREYIEAAKIAGASPLRIIFKELLPNLATTILVQATLTLPAIITAVAGLSFLGVGFTSPTPDLGRMFSDAAQYYESDITYLVFPGVALTTFVLAFNLLGDAVRDALDPKTIR